MNLIKALLILLTVTASSVAMTADLNRASTKVAVVITDEEAGYDQAAYDECMDQDDTTASQCESIN